MGPASGRSCSTRATTSSTRRHGSTAPGTSSTSIDARQSSRPARSSNEDSIERLDLRSGERKRILMNGADPALSPDGKLIVYVHLTQGQPDGLWSANIDGSSARPFFKTKDTWWYLQAPRFSPNGCEIVFSAAGHTVASLPIGAKAGFAHLNIPSELYVAPCDGTSVKAI